MLPQVLHEYWQASDDELYSAIHEGRFEGVNVSSLLRAYLDLQGEEHKVEGQGSPSLKRLVLARIIAELKASSHFQALVTHIAETLDNVTYRQLLLDPKLPHCFLRAFLRVPHPDNPAGGTVDRLDLVDIDDVILANEKYLQQATEGTQDDFYLVTLKNLKQILAIPADNNNAIQCFKRTGAPKDGLEFFNFERESEAQVIVDQKTFTEAFHKATLDLLSDLDWTGVMVMGECLLTTLISANEKRNGGAVKLYLYGLSPDEANAKVNEIHRSWLNKLPPNNEQQLVIKTANSIILAADASIPTVHVECRLFQNRTVVLLACQYDPYAIGYDGTRVVMLPRCARALETGYSIFTSRLCWGLDHGECRLKAKDLINLADFGFGVRILASYARCLTKQDINDECGEHASGKVASPKSRLGKLDKITESARTKVRDLYLMDDPNEPGAQIVRPHVPDERVSHQNAPGQALALNSLSRLIEISESWRFSTIGAKYKFDHPVYRRVPVIGNQLDRLDWDDEWDLEDFEQDIDRHNQDLFGYLQEAISQKLQIPIQRSGYSGYLTRRIRRQIYGPDIETVQQKQLTMPLIIPFDLEEYIGASFLTQESGSPWCTHSPLVSVHDPSKHDSATARLPSLVPTSDESGNLMYWVLSNESIWLGQDTTQSAVYEALMCLFSWFMHVSNGGNPSYRMDSPECLVWTISYLRRKLGILPDSTPSNENDGDRRSQGLPPLKEARFFQAFVDGDLLPDSLGHKV